VDVSTDDQLRDIQNFRASCVTKFSFQGCIAHAPSEHRSSAIKLTVIAVMVTVMLL